MNDIATTSLTPDGYQVIDVTTGERINHDEIEILSWQIASQILSGLDDTGQYVIIAVTEAQVRRDAERSTVRYLPEFLRFSLGTTSHAPEGGPYTPVAHSPLPDSAENELCLNPRITNRLIALLGLPVESAPEGDQKAWQLALVRNRLAETPEGTIKDDPEIADGLEQLRGLVDQADDLFSVDLLILEHPRSRQEKDPGKFMS